MRWADVPTLAVLARRLLEPLCPPLVVLLPIRKDFCTDGILAFVVVLKERCAIAARLLQRLAHQRLVCTPHPDCHRVVRLLLGGRRLGWRLLRDSQGRAQDAAAAAAAAAATTTALAAAAAAALATTLAAALAAALATTLATASWLLGHKSAVDVIAKVEGPTELIAFDCPLASAAPAAPTSFVRAHATGRAVAREGDDAREGLSHEKATMWGY